MEFVSHVYTTNFMKLIYKSYINNHAKLEEKWITRIKYLKMQMRILNVFFTMTFSQTLLFVTPPTFL